MQPLRTLLSLWLVAVLSGLGVADVRADGARPGAATRIVSLNPSLTEILIALDASERLVGIDDFSAQLEPSLAALPRVGGLFNPSLEAVVALRPDLVVVVPSVEQRDFRDRLTALGIDVEEFENHRFDDVLENITRLGVIAGRVDSAERRVAEIERSRVAVRGAVARLSAARGGDPRVVVVLQRDPLFVVGANNFIDTLLRDAGGRNLAATFDDDYPRVAMEWLIEAGPEILIDLSPGAATTLDHWSRWPAIPAVARERLIALDPTRVSMPGPRLDVTLELLARSLWGAELDAVLARERARLAEHEATADTADLEAAEPPLPHERVGDPR